MLRASTHLVAAFALAGTSLALLAPACASAPEKPFKVESKWNIGGEGSWDYLTVDSAAHRLYIAHLTKVDVVDTTTGKVIGAVTGLNHCHGVVLGPDAGVAFVSDGGANAVVAFDTKTFATLAKIPAGTNPDGMVYEPGSKTLWAFNGGSKNVTVIDVAARKAVGTIALPGKPEFPATHSGTVYVNIEDKNEIVVLNSKEKRITGTFPLPGCESPSGLAMDAAGERLFSVCDGKKMVVTSASTGKTLGAPTIGDGPDATAYDAKRKLAFSSNGENGTLSVVDAGKPGYPVLQTLPTQKGARTLALDEATGKVYLVSAQAGKKEPGAKRATPVPGSFTVLVVGRD